MIKLKWLPKSSLMVFRDSIISRIALRRLKGSSGSCFENLIMTGFHSSKTAWATSKFRLIWKSSRKSIVTVAFGAFSKNSNSTETTSDEKKEYSRARFLKFLASCFLDPGSFKNMWWDKSWSNLVRFWDYLRANMSVICMNQRSNPGITLKYTYIHFK